MLLDAFTLWDNITTKQSELYQNSDIAPESLIMTIP